jgi:hypothetical protein
VLAHVALQREDAHGRDPSHVAILGAPG